MRSKEIGNSSQTEKRLLRDMEVFSSPQFLRLVQRIGKEITSPGTRCWIQYFMWTETASAESKRETRPARLSF